MAGVKRKGEGVVSFDFVWTTVCVNHYYVYFIDEDVGPRLPEDLWVRAVHPEAVSERP